MDEIKRRISLDVDKFNYNIDFVFYGFLLSIATAKPKNKQTELGNDEWELYLSEAKYKKCRPLLRKWLGDVSAQTVRNKLKKFIDIGMIAYNEKEKIYTFPYDYNSKYYIVSRDIIFYLCGTASSTVIQTYIYLASRFAWKKDYEFTVTEIKNALGYSPNSQNSPIEKFIKAGLASLQVQGFIKFDVIQTKATSEDDKYKTQRYILRDVTTSIMPEKVKIELKKVLPSIKPNIGVDEFFKIEQK